MNSVEDDSPSLVKHELGSSGPEATQHFVSLARIAFRPGAVRHLDFRTDLPGAWTALR